MVRFRSREQNTKEMKLRHIKTGFEGTFIKEFKPTGRPYYSTVILLSDGREYAAPSYEFEVIF